MRKNSNSQKSTYAQFRHGDFVRVKLNWWPLLFRQFRKSAKLNGCLEWCNRMYCARNDVKACSSGFTRKFIYCIYFLFFLFFVPEEKDRQKSREKELKNREVRKYTTFVVRGRQPTENRWPVWMLWRSAVLLLRTICARDRSNMLFSAGKRDFPFQTNAATAAASTTTTMRGKCSVCEQCLYSCVLVAKVEPLTRSSHTAIQSIVIEPGTREHYLLFSLFGWMRWILDTEGAIRMHSPHQNDNEENSFWCILETELDPSKAIVKQKEKWRKTLRKREQLECNKCSAPNGVANSFTEDLFYCKYGNSIFIWLHLVFMWTRARHWPVYMCVCVSGVCMRSALIFGLCTARSTDFTRMLFKRIT